MDAVTYALCKKFALKVAAGFSAVKVDEPNCAIVFTLNDGKQATLHIPKPKDGLSVKNLEIQTGPDSKQYLICTLSDDSIINAGEFPSTPIVLKEDLVPTQSLGSVIAGKKYVAGTSLEQIIRDILIKEEAPIIALSHIPVDALYDVVTDTVDKLTIKANVLRKTNDIAKIELYVNGAIVKTITAGVAAGGTFTYEHTFATPTNSNITLKAIVTDIKNLKSTTTSIIKFVGKSYYGTVDEAIVKPTDGDIKGLNSTLKDTLSFTYDHIAVDYGKILYAYPAEFGMVSKIADADGRDYTSSYTSGTTKVDGIDYYYYLLTDAMGTDDGYQNFS